MLTHGVDHWDPDNCPGCRYKTVGVAPAAMPSRNPALTRTRARADATLADCAAYRQLRKEGHHPEQVHGSTALARKADAA